jgi:hypothetical protein
MHRIASAQRAPAHRPASPARRSRRRRLLRRRLRHLATLALLGMILLVTCLGRRDEAAEDFVLVPAPQEALIDASVMIPATSRRLDAIDPDTAGASAPAAGG